MRDRKVLLNILLFLLQILMCRVRLDPTACIGKLAVEKWRILALLLRALGGGTLPITKVVSET
jgi:hypothetical protein